MTTIKVNDQTIELSNKDKPLFPDAGISKSDLIDYYRRIASTILPYMSERPLSMQRFPDGIEGEGFYQKEVPDYFPDWIDRVSVEVKEEGSEQLQVICNKAATLVYLANQACITPHIWLSRQDKLDYPDRLIFDLDPPGDDFEIVRRAAQWVREALEAVGLTSLVMTTGSRGLHVVTPLDRQANFDTVRAFARDMAERIADQAPDRLTIEPRKNKRKGRLFLDYLRNAYAQTAVPPYAVRAKPGAPVATPLDWQELNNPQLHSQQYNLQNIFRRLGQKSDPWRGKLAHGGSLTEAQHQLKSI